MIVLYIKHEYFVKITLICYIMYLPIKKKKFYGTIIFLILENILCKY